MGDWMEKCSLNCNGNFNTLSPGEGSRTTKTSFASVPTLIIQCVYPVQCRRRRDWPVAWQSHDNGKWRQNSKKKLPPPTLIQADPAIILLCLCKAIWQVDGRRCRGRRSSLWGNTAFVLKLRVEWRYWSTPSMLAILTGITTPAASARYRTCSTLHPCFPFLSICSSTDTRHWPSLPTQKTENVFITQTTRVWINCNRATHLSLAWIFACVAGSKAWFGAASNAKIACFKLAVYQHILGFVLFEQMWEKLTM